MKFTDIIYGDIDIPSWLEPFLMIPEFVRLRGVRLSNIDSIDLKDFNTPTRWEHSIGAANLALYYSKIRNLSEVEKIHLTLAALLHDIGTPPYAHTVEYILSNFDHEEQSHDLITGNEEDFSFESVGAGFISTLNKLKKETKLNIEPEKIAEIVIGEGKYGFLINGSIDIDNIDNLIRASFYSGIQIEKEVPFQLIKWLSKYDSSPTDLYNQKNSAVSKWLSYRNTLYKKFYDSKNDLGRQAFLQHIIRRAYNEGLGKKPIVFNTDDRLLYTIENFSKKDFFYKDKKYKNPLSLLVNKFRLIEKVVLLTSIPIESEDNLRILSNPLFANWLELELYNYSFEPFVLVNKKRYKDSSLLFDNVTGTLNIYVLASTTIEHKSLPEWLRKEINPEYKGLKLINTIQETLKSLLVNDWIVNKPWHTLNKFRKVDIVTNLKHEKDWSFKNDRNKSIHIYQATFVRTIPNKIISSLGIKGELIIDPFGGTGQTAEEAVRLGCPAISSDINHIAYLTSKVKLTFLSKSIRDDLRSINSNIISNINNFKIPTFDKIEKWHHKETIIELSKILSYINNETNNLKKNFLKVCFSDILMSVTDRKGKGHSYFADNTPLAKGKNKPAYRDAINSFINKINKNIDTIENLYSYLERRGRNPETELKKVKVFKANVKEISPEYYNIEKKSAAAIITSPPYLCMIDYTLGQRLSYNWLFPEVFNEDFKNEIGSRRKRNNPQKAYQDYIDDINIFIEKSKSLIRKNGYLVLVIGEPTAKAFVEYDIIKKINDYIVNNGYTKIWEIERPINWHRNHGLSSLEKERILIYLLNE